MMTFGDVHPIPTGGLIIKKREKTCTFHQTKPIWIAGTIPFTYAFVFFLMDAFPFFLVQSSKSHATHLFFDEEVSHFLMVVMFLRPTQPTCR
jgi:hypothetical protein